MVYRKKNQRLKKRFHISASAGRNVPFIGGSKFSFGLGKRSLASTVKKIVRSGIEATHYKIFSGSTTQTNLLHNTLYTTNLLGNIPRGDNWNNRNGDIIHISCIDLNLKLTANINNDLRNDVKMNWWIIRDEDEYLSGSDSIGSGVGSTKFINSPTDVTEGIWDPKKVTVVKQGYQIFKPWFGTYSGSPLTLNVGTTQSHHRLMICPNAKFTFETGTNYGKNPNYYLVLCATVYAGSTGTTVVGQAVVDGQIKFKNSQ